MKQSIYVVRKYIKATSVASAIRKDKQTQVHDCYMDDYSSKKFLDNLLKE